LLKLNEEENVTILLVEQKLPFARRVGQQFTIMDKGRSVASGPMQNLSNQLIQKHLTV
jgi:urea transport system ATP-binding protein